MFFRMFLGLPGAAIVTALLFLAMGWMIRMQEPTIGVPPPPVESFVYKEPPPTPVPPAPDIIKVETPKPVEIDFPKITENPGPTIKVDPLPGPKGGGGGLKIITNVLQPTVKFPPAYPESCRSRGAEGVVVVEFDVTPEGNVINPRIISSADSCFERTVLRSIANWKYTPQTDADGRPIVQRGVREFFNFQLTD